MPLVVANVNDDAIASHNGIVANPNCTTMALMMAAGPLHAPRLRVMTATSYQSVSGSGQTGMEQLSRSTALWTGHQRTSSRWLDRPRR